ncbi:uncharacterized protein [Temnothorax nylanderi]|uniref:uncharacterized protein n=1 Tax=Temnothorax nylanderi TaxID=102681 RepID=UPI003A83A3A5
MAEETSIELERLYTNIIQTYRTLETLQRPVKTWDDFLVLLTVQKLDSESIKAWENKLGSSKVPPSWQELNDFLITRLLSLKAYEKSREAKTALKPQKATAKAHHQQKSGETSSSNTLGCSICKGEHYVVKCPKYVDETVAQRLALIVKHQLCYNCLRKHRVANCKVTKRCKKCKKKHHTTIHKEDVSFVKKETKSEPLPQSNSASVDQNQVKVLHSTVDETSPLSCVLLATAQVLIVSEKNEVRKVRALLDQGSEISLISERVVQQLKLPRVHSSISLTGIGEQKSNTTKGFTSFKIRSHFGSELDLTVAAYILPKLTSSIPSVKIPAGSWPHLEGIRLADPKFLKPGSIDLILGADIYGYLLEGELLKGSVESPVAQATKLGWVISGPTTIGKPSVNKQVYHVSVNQELYDLVYKFWEVEEVPSSKVPILSKEEQECEDYFLSTHRRDETGRYIVKLPFKSNPDRLGNSKDKALRLIRNLSGRFKSNSNYFKVYSDFMLEYKNLGHMKRVSSSQAEPSLDYYLPHHGVLREQSLTTKLRVVFNGSSPTTTGVSLNDLLHTGAKLQIDLFDVLLWFRLFLYVFIADIEKMFRQIKIDPSDWDFQRIFWLDDMLRIIIFVLTTVTYGQVCSPFLALRTLIQLLKDEGHRFPLAIPIMEKGRYVDEFHGGADSIKETQKKVAHLDQLCMAGGFILKKWMSNHPDVLEYIPAERKITSHSISFNEGDTVYILGLSWNAVSDSFEFNFELPTLKTVTKRTVLSTIAKFFDPIGFLSPITVVGKIFVQDLWSAKLDWDEPLPDRLFKKWTDFVDSLRNMPKFEFPRWIGLKSDSLIEVHGFSDASQRAMAAVVYVRVISSDGKITTCFIALKTKVAPLNKLTIPRLELIAAVLLVKLVLHILKVINLLNIPIFLRIDSEVALTWILGHPSKWKEFVQNRVSFIQKTLPQAVWQFISGKDNPADLATRGLTPQQLLESRKWWTGPHWLTQHQSTWPNDSYSLSSSDNLEEKPIRVATTLTSESPKIWDLLNKYSNLTKLLRITALCKRVIKRFRGIKESSFNDPLTVTELTDSKLFWIKTVQQAYFSCEIKTLADGKDLPKSNALLKLTPRLDKDGLLRVGRLERSFLPENAKHPYILPRDSILSSLVIADAHARTFHGGVQDTLSFIRNNYWIIGGRIVVRSFIIKCVVCTRNRQERAQQVMGQLPVERITPSRPFEHSGVDYAGPFTIKTWRGRNAKTYKAYIALFTCFSTSAIHLELVTDYTTEAFIAAYKRFTSRRGICSTLSSDCGTNLKGADAELRKLFLASSQESGDLAKLLAKDGTQWNFIPPAAPHFGRKWEAGVKSVKLHLKRVVGNQLLTFEEMNTLLIQIEAVLNSRPISPQSDNPNDISALTPGHFLVGQPLTTIPEPTLEGIKVSHLSRWQLIRKMLEDFWQQWSRDCLQRYLAVYKWNKVVPSIKIGSLVLVVDERYPPSKWPLGRVVQTHPGQDGHTRVVTVRTQMSELQRPITKLCLLPINTETL